MSAPKSQQQPLPHQHLQTSINQVHLVAAQSHQNQQNHHIQQQQLHQHHHHHHQNHQHQHQHHQQLQHQHQHQHHKQQVQLQQHQNTSSTSNSGQQPAGNRSASAGPTDEDVMSYWSDSAASNCDQISSSPASCSQVSSPSTGFHQQQQQHNHHNHQHQPHPQHEQHEHQRVANEGASSGHKSRCNTHGGRNVRKRVQANERERERTKSLNRALEVLRNKLPVAEAEKRSKIQTLRMAKEYIEFLARLKSTGAPTATHVQPVNDEHVLHASQLTRQTHYEVKPLVDQASQLPTVQGQPESPLTYKFYKFRLKSLSRNE